MDRLIELECKARDFIKASDYENAIVTYQQLLTLSPNWEHGQGCYELAWCLEQLGRHDEALPWYRTAVFQRPTYDTFCVGYANLAASLGDPIEALQCLLAIVKNKSSYTTEAPALLLIAAQRAGWSKGKLIDAVAATGFFPDIADHINRNWGSS